MSMGYTPIWEAEAALVIAVMVAIALSGWLLIHIRRHIDMRQRKGLMLLVLAFVSAIIFYWYISLPPNPPRFVERYMVHVSPFLYAFTGVIAYLGYKIGKHRQA